MLCVMNITVISSHWPQNFNSALAECGDSVADTSGGVHSPAELLIS